jgi:NhaP-type Na+/H+ or K+/H+ antiporter
VDHGVVSVVGVVAACFVLWALTSDRLTKWGVSAPILFVGLGLILTHGPITWAHLSLHSSAIEVIAELTLAIVLFADASRVNARTLRNGAALPLRLLVIGLPLTIALGSVVGLLLLRGVGAWVICAIAAIVAPTDAALGASIMEDERVPTAIRRVLNIESGLNDGIATPFVNLFLAGAVSTAAVHRAHLGRAAIDLVGGAAMGIGLGLATALLLRLALERGWAGKAAVPLGVVGLALVAYALAVVAGVNGFVSAFVSGSAFGSVLTTTDIAWRDFAEETGTLLSLTVWFIFGAVMLVPGLQDVNWRQVVFALAALTLVRMVPVAISTAGTRLDKATVLFIGWFGPRGLASVVFGLIAVDTLHGADARVVLGTVTATVLLSVVLHGVTAGVGARAYGESIARTHPDGPEHASVHPVITRSLVKPRADT